MDEGLENRQLWGNTINEVISIPYSAITSICITIISSFGVELAFLNFVFLVVLVKFREALFVKCINFLWITLLLLILVALCVSFYLSSLTHITLSYCSVLT